MRPKGALLAVTAWLALAVAPAQAIEPFTADYQASYMGMQANGQMTLASAGKNRWRYSLNISNALADLTQSTVFETHDGQWRPLSSDDANKVLVKRSSKSATYDWSSGVARWTGDVKPERAGPIKLKPGDMDALMINLAVVRDVAAGKPLKYRLVDDGRVKQLEYAVAGQETITIEGKSHQATKVVSDDGKRQITAWVVEGMPVPARIVQREKGKDSLELMVRSVR
jgi:hypothetical protein